VRFLLWPLLWIYAFSCFAQSSPTEAPRAHCPTPPLLNHNPAKSMDAPPGTADLDSVLAAVGAAIKCYQDNRGDGPDALPHLQQAQFDFKTTTGKVGGVTVSFFIFKLGTSKEVDSTNQLSFTYSRQKATNAGNALKIEKKPQFLADAVVADMQSAAAAVKLRARLNDLTFNKFTLTLQYGIVFDGNVGVNVPIQLVTLGPTVDRKRNDVQTITLTFSDTDPTSR
jgi:hypothetical protein